MRRTTCPRLFSMLALALLTAACDSAAQPPSRQSETASSQPGTPTWIEAENGILENQMQITFADRFYKAGESYFSPDDSRVIFQAVETPKAGEEPDEYYGMYVATVLRDKRGQITGLADIKRVSPKGSANTCGWFHPIRPDVILFASTLGLPSEGAPPGYQRATGRYRWMFPPEMTIVTRVLSPDFDPDKPQNEVLIDAEDAYVAEGSWTRDGRHIIYCSLETGDGDLYVAERTDRGLVRRCIVSAPGYDGGPFFSPDGKRICYRSDRRKNHYLQLFVADLKFDDTGAIVGVEREYQLTDNDSVNWGPFWHPNGRDLVYATSEMGHQNYEVFMLDADAGDNGPIRYGTHKRRVTHADGADVLPAFNSDGKTMIWTSQRGADGRSQLWVADFAIDVDAPPVPQEEQGTKPADEAKGWLSVEDPETGVIYIYDRTTHQLSVYDPASHERTPVSDSATSNRAMELFQRQAATPD